jgi:hypothetical protein
MSLKERYIEYTIDCYDREEEPMTYEEWFAEHKKKIAYVVSQMCDRERAYRAYTSLF